MGIARRIKPRSIYAALLISVLLITLVVPGLFAAWIAPHDPFRISGSDRLRPPAWMDEGSAQHPLGTDIIGRDLLSRIVHGARVELLVSAVCITASGLIGVPLGLLARNRGGWCDTVIMRLTSVVRWVLVVFGFLIGLGFVIALVGWLVFLIQSRGRFSAAWSMLWADRIISGRGALNQSQGEMRRRMG